MYTRRNRLTAAFLILAIALLIGSVQSIGAQQGPDLGQVALETIAKANNLDVSRLKIITSTEGSSANAGSKVFSFKAMDKETSEIYGVSLNEAGAQVDLQQEIEAAKAATEAQFGRIDPAFAVNLTALPEDQPVDVIIWLYEGDSPTPDRPDVDTPPEEAAARVEAASEARAAFVSGLTAPVVDRLANMGLVARTDKTIPFIYASLTPATIKEVAAWPEVRMVYEDGVAQPELNSVWRSTAYFYMFDKYHLVGRGTKVGVVEVGGRASAANPYLWNFTQSGAASVCPSATDHSTAVLGIIFSDHPTYTGLAQGTTPWVGGSCGGVISELQNEATAAVAWGAQIVNTSWGANIGLVPGSMDVFFDNMVRNSAKLVVKSAGNEADGCSSGTGNVTSPGLGYNMLTVGNFNDNNTETWADDTMDACSSFVDPTSSHSDREKPEVAAPGDLFFSTTIASPWVGSVGGGTSYAAPVVTSAGLLALERWKVIGYFPERLKALLMVASTHNIEGVSRLSEFDGAGGLTIWESDRVAAGTNSGSGQLSYTCAAASPLTLGSIPLIGGVRSRVAVVWSQNTAYANYTTQPDADLDLRILNPSSAVVASSASFDNSYEIVDFVPATTGTYTVQMTKFRCDMDPTWMGWAWWRK